MARGYPLDMAERTHWSKFDSSGMTGVQRDELVVKLRAEGWKYREIADHVGMSISGVYTVLERVAEGRPGRDPRH